MLPTRFNPRARDGREAWRFTSSPTINRFNPRARDGRELCINPLCINFSVSIHAPVMDANFYQTSHVS